MTFSCEVVAIGSELLLGQIVDTNSAWIGQELANLGINSHYQTKVGDNADRMADALKLALDRSEAVICCGGLGPTQDDITRDVIAQVMGVPLVPDDELADRIRKMFSTRNRPMPQNNLLQARIPQGGWVNPAMPGTAPGFICPAKDSAGNQKMIYAVPGVPWEMKEMFHAGIAPDIAQRAGITSIIDSRVLKTWGRSESGLAELLADEITRLDDQSDVTIAFLASGWNGLKVRITAKGADQAAVDALLDEEEARVRAITGDELIFGVDDESMESVVLDLCKQQGLKLATAESLTGGLIGARLTDIPGASAAYVGSVVSYASEVKFDVLGVPEGPVVSGEAAEAMARGVCGALKADVSLAVTGVAGPSPQEGNEPGTVWFATCVNGETESQHIFLPFDRERIRQFTTITALNALRLRLDR